MAFQYFFIRNPRWKLPEPHILPYAGGKAWLAGMGMKDSLMGLCEDDAAAWDALRGPEARRLDLPAQGQRRGAGA